jgi:hypothetical protein
MAKTVHIKATTIELRVKTNGLELQINEKDGKQFGDVYVTKTGLKWAKGRTQRKNAITIDYETLDAICRNLSEVKKLLKSVEKEK